MLATALAPVIGYDEAAKLAKEALQVRPDDPRPRARARHRRRRLDGLLDPAAMTEPGLGGGSGRRLTAASPGTATIAAMSADAAAWDRAGSPRPSRVDGRLARPELAALPEELPSVDELFTFMRDAELRFGDAAAADRGAGLDDARRGARDDGVIAAAPGRGAGPDDPRRRGRAGRLRGLALRRRDRPDLRRAPAAWARSGRSATGRAGRPAGLPRPVRASTRR